MTARLKPTPTQFVALALLAVPAWKVAEWSFGGFAPVGWTPTRWPPARSCSTTSGPRATRWPAATALDRSSTPGPASSATEQADPAAAGRSRTTSTVYGLLPVCNVLPETDVPTTGVVHQDAVSPALQETLDLVAPGLPHAQPAAGSVGCRRRFPAVPGSASPSGTPGAVRPRPARCFCRMRTAGPPARPRRGRPLLGLNSAVDPKVRGRLPRLADGRLGRFGWKSEFATMADFVKAACANELGLSNPGRDQATPLGHRDYHTPGTDLTDEQCSLMTDFIIGLPRPVQVVPAEPATRGEVVRGREVFDAIGCADCHSPKVGPLDGIYSDLLLHDLGPELSGSPGIYGQPVPVETGDFATVRAAGGQRVADPAALGRRRLGPLPPRRPGEGPRRGHRRPRRRVGGRPRAIQSAPRGRSHRAPRISRQPEVAGGAGGVRQALRANHSGYHGSRPRERVRSQRDPDTLPKTGAVAPGVRSGAGAFRRHVERWGRMATVILVCACGKRIRADGVPARPGRQVPGLRRPSDNPRAISEAGGRRRGTGRGRRCARRRTAHGDTAARGSAAAGAPQEEIEGPRALLRPGAAPGEAGIEPPGEPEVSALGRLGADRPGRSAADPGRHVATGRGDRPGPARRGRHAAGRAVLGPVPGHGGATLWILVPAAGAVPDDHCLGRGAAPTLAPGRPV